jgi:hypothetical protein
MTKINALIENTKAAIVKIYSDLQERDNYATAETVHNVFLGATVKQQTLLQLCDKLNRERKPLIGISISAGNTALISERATIWLIFYIGGTMFLIFLFGRLTNRLSAILRPILLKITDMYTTRCRTTCKICGTSFILPLMLSILPRICLPLFLCRSKISTGRFSLRKKWNE